MTACLLLILVVCLITFELQLASLARHDCAETECHICLFIANIEQIIRTACACGVCLLFVFSFGGSLGSAAHFCRQPAGYPHTPVMQKVKFSC